MAISPSGRSDIYWIDGELTQGDGCRSTWRKDPYELSDTTKLIFNKNKTVDIQQRNDDIPWWNIFKSKVHGIQLTKLEYEDLLTRGSITTGYLKNIRPDANATEVVGTHRFSGFLARVGVFQIKGKLCTAVDIRKEEDVKYEKKGQIIPIKESVTLTEDEWMKISELS